MSAYVVTEGNGVVFFMILPLMWMHFVLSNVVHVTTSGVVAAWHFSPALDDVVKPSLRRACTTSLGSICLGSFLVSFLALCRVLVRSCKDRRLAFMACVVDWLLTRIETGMAYFNAYAFVYVALYGQPYFQAASETWEMIKVRGFDVIINDDLSYVVVFMGCLMGGIISGAVGAAWYAHIYFFQQKSIDLFIHVVS
jgi:hypothetical protein